jgi:hypothetical protein
MHKCASSVSNAARGGAERPRIDPPAPVMVRTKHAAAPMTSGPSLPRHRVVGGSIEAVDGMTRTSRGWPATRNVTPPLSRSHRWTGMMPQDLGLSRGGTAHGRSTMVIEPSAEDQHVEICYI